MGSDDRADRQSVFPRHQVEEPVSEPLPRDDAQATVTGDTGESTKTGAVRRHGNRLFILAVALLFIVFPGLRWLLSQRSPADLPNKAGNSLQQQSSRKDEMKVDRPTVPAEPVARAAEMLNQSFRYALSGQFTECVDTAKEAVRLDPASAAAFNNLGFCLAGLRHWEEAIMNTKEAIRLDPTMQSAGNNLAWILEEQAKHGGE
jgi:tetratricopeptide (TPR) repeat protein